jgi:Holin of 3TMs, for gene-transfer release
MADLPLLATDESLWRAYWRPAMGWVYMAICLFDFIIAPTGTSILITFYKSTIPVWRSLTLENGGIMHLSFGAILGVAAWGRTKETINGYGGYGPGGYPPPYNPYGGGGGYYQETETEIQVPMRRPRPPGSKSNPQNGPNPPINMPPPNRPPIR